MPGSPVKLVAVSELRAQAEAIVTAFALDYAPVLAAAELHHVGATSLPWGHTKGDVDVNVRVTAPGFPATVEALRNLLSVAQPENWTATFASFATDRYGLPLGVQVTAIGSTDDVLLAWRDRLRADPKLLRDYDEAKRAAAPGGTERYWQAKDRFLAEKTVPG